ncbi:MAG: SOS response-associated peptidase [Deltaproteobacteria bacterium]|nr:SOS response-associated peptidase [Deltaproteobacteria bacterium]
MCGRYTLSAEPKLLARAFGLTVPPPTTPRYNIAPTQQVPIVRSAGHGVELALVRWGLIPARSPKPEPPGRTINARAETIDRLPSFRESFYKRRCLVPASGFYEWQRADGAKQPYYIQAAAGEAMAFAGVWDRWLGPGGPIESCAIITTGANTLVAKLHTRMPAIIAPEDYAVWLAPDTAPVRLRALLRPFASERLRAFAVSTLVNDPKHELPACVEPLPF